jgi:hypothetical protein
MTPNTVNRLAIASSILAALLLCALATSRHCETAPATPVAAVAMEAPPPPPAVVAPSVVTEQDIEVVVDVSADDELNKVRQAARDLVKAANPSLKQDGVFTLAIRPGNLYIAGVDTSEGNKKRTVDVLVRRYVRKSGGVYWRAESLGPEQAAEYARMSPEY